MSDPNEIILELSGNIQGLPLGDVIEVKRETIDKLPQKSIKTTNHVESILTLYKGPLFIDLLKAIGANGTKVTVIAWDDYLAEISVSDLTNYPVILATSENGRKLTLEDKGPLFVVFPFTDFPELRNDLYYNKSVWQIRAIEVE
jgi:hypothetical protein